MKVVSIISDGLLNARNIMLEMSIDEYLSIGIKILDNNKYQRRRISNAPMMYSLLSRDLVRLCTMPPIVLAFDEIECGKTITIETSSEVLQEVLSSNSLLILDGLQRTSTMLDVQKDVNISKDDRQRFLSHTIRVEIYVGITRTGILYRMLTLNSGQTPMSKRHQIEILYSKYKDINIDNIQFVCQTDDLTKSGLDMYDFDDVIEGFNSFINMDESPIDKIEIREIVQNLEKITNDNYQKELFESFIRAYNAFVHRINDISDGWEYKNVEAQISSIYGKDIVHIFRKSQTISAFGAAIGHLLYEGDYLSLEQLEESYQKIVINDDSNLVFEKILVYLDRIRQKAPKIGVEQRAYLKMFFISLLSPDSGSAYKIKDSADISYNIYTKERWA